MLGRCIGFALAGLAAATSAHAQDDFARTGPYLGAAGVVGIYTELNNELDQFGSDSVDPSPGADSRVGYRAHPNFAAEVEGEWLAHAKVGSNSDIDNEWIVTGNLKGYILTGRVQPYALVGFGYMDLDVNNGFDPNGQFAARLGGGVDVYLTPHILGTLGASYVIPDDELHDFAYVSVLWGFGYRF